VNLGDWFCLVCFVAVGIMKDLYKISSTGCKGTWMKGLSIFIFYGYDCLGFIIKYGTSVDQKEL